jgi:hypothetical protein
MVKGLVAAATLLMLSHQTLASEKSPTLRRISCSLVRFYVARYSEAAAETWARSHGATDAEIETARRCLVGSNMQRAILEPN